MNSIYQTLLWGVKKDLITHVALKETCEGVYVIFENAKIIFNSLDRDESQKIFIEILNGRIKRHTL